MERGGQYGWADVASYAPHLELDVPPVASGCHAVALVALSPAVYFDPFTARLTDAPHVENATLLGTLELEKPVGWTERKQSASTIENIPRMWWEGAAEDDMEKPCEGHACEYTALLLTLDGHERRKVNVPLHMRYVPAQHIQADDDDDDAYSGAAWLEDVSLPSWVPDVAQSAWRAMLPAVQRGAHALHHVRRRTRAWSKPHYSDIDLLPDVPLYLAACDERQPDMEWDPTDTSLLLPSTHTHLMPQLERHLKRYVLYEPPTMPHANTPSTARVPVGNASLAPAVQLATLACVCLASYVLCRSILFVRKSAHQ